MKDKFEQYFGTLPGGNNPKILCPWHEDTDASLTLDYKTGYATCYGCDARHHIDSLLDGVTKEISKETVMEYHYRLLEENTTQQYLNKIKGWTPAVLKEYLMGFDGHRITIPIWADKIGGKCVNIRRYHPSKSPKMLPFSAGYAALAWFPYPPDTSEVFLMEGESDTIQARSMGLPAFTQTGGAGYWCEKFTSDLSGRKVHVVYDQDRAGQNGARMVVNKIKFVCEVRNLRLPVSSGRKDFSDWVLHDGGDLPQLKDLLMVTAPYAVSKMQGNVDDPTTLPLFETANARWAYKGVICDVVVAGKDRSPYMIPYKYTVECSPDKKKPLCSGCHNLSGRATKVIDWKDGKLTRFVDLPDMHRDSVLLEMAEINRACKVCRVTVNEFQNIEKLALFPRKDALIIDTDQPAEVNMLRKAYFLGFGVQTNAVYRCKGIPIPDTRDQTSVLLIIEAEPVDTVEEITDLTLCECFRLEGEKDADNVTGKGSPGEL